MEQGRGTHVVDFVEHPLRADSVLLVRPGQVQQWHLNSSLQGMLVLVSSDALAPSIARADKDMKLLAMDDWPASTSVSPTLFEEVAGDAHRLRADIERFDGGALDAAMIRHALLALLLRLARELRTAQAHDAATREATIYRLFIRELETGYATRPSVLDHAARIGYSESTLSRACVATVGLTAKQVIDRRIALEAKRLLIHSEATAAHVGHQLGFSEPTNFVKFFRRLEGTTPDEFRRRFSLATQRQTEKAPGSRARPVRPVR